MPLQPPSGALVTRLLDLLFPPRCASCGARGAPLCAACVATIRAPEWDECARCYRPLPRRAGAEPAGLCAICQADTSAHLSGLRVAARYEGVVRQAIRQLKYHQQRRLAEPLGDLLADVCATLAPQIDLIVPVPLHPSRQRQRGYNQAELLARQCAARLGLPVRPNVLHRIRATPPQVGLGAAARVANVAGAFAASAAAPAALAGRRLLLVDDVCTSGATLTSAADALLAAGAVSVWGLAVARPALDADVATAHADTHVAGTPSRRSP
jgi:ComF family protein